MEKVKTMRSVVHVNRVACLAGLLMWLGTGAAGASSIAVTWDANPDPKVLGYVVYVGTQAGTYSQQFDVGNTTWFTLPNPVAGQQYFFTVASYVDGPLVGPLSVEVSGFSNAPPSLTPPGDQTSTVGVTATLQLHGSDPYGDPLSYSAAGLPPGLTLASSTGFISGTPTTAGQYSVTAMVTDGTLFDTKEFTWTTVAESSAEVLVPEIEEPSLAITLPTNGQSYTSKELHTLIGGTAYSGAGIVEVAWSSSRGGSGRASGTESWLANVPLKPGQNTITLTARDGNGRTASRSITVQQKK